MLSTLSCSGPGQVQVISLSLSLSLFGPGYVMNVTTFYTRGTKFFTTLKYILDKLETIAIRAFFDCIKSGFGYPYPLFRDVNMLL